VGKLNKKTLPEPLLVGREKELGDLQRHLDLVFEGKGTTIFISGEAGSGKTRLSKEFLEAAKAKNVITLTGWCLSNAAVPYFPFIEAFNSFESNNEEETKILNTERLSLATGLTGSRVVEGLEQTKVLNPQIWQDQAFNTITKELLHLSTNKPTILFIDDLHWADSASLALLHYIARAVNMERILVIATFRSEELKTAIDGHPHPLAEVLRLMGREGLFQEIKLSNLNQRDVGRIAENMLSGVTDSEFIEKLSEESNGNPLFLVESLRMMHSQGNIVKENGQWHLANADIFIPDKVRDVILRRLESLRTHERRILDTASVIGEKFSPNLVADVLSQNHLDVLEALKVIAQSTLLVFSEGHNYRFKHDKIRERLCSEIPPALRIEYHLRIAEILESNNPVATFPLGDIAYHYIEAQNGEKAIKYSLLAGQDALTRCSNAEAIKHFEYVLQTISNFPENERRIALEGLGDAYYANCMFEQAIRSFEELARIGTDAIKLRALRKEMEAVWYKEMDSLRLMELVKQAEPYTVLDRLESARVRWNRGRALLWLGDVKSSLIDHEEALRVFEEEGSLIDTAFALWGTGITRVILGSDEKKGLGEIMRGISIHKELGDVHGEVLALRNGGVETFSLCGLYQEAGIHAARVLRLGQQIGDFNNLAGTLVALSDISEITGDIAQSLTNALKAQEFASKTDSEGTKCKVHARLAELYALRKDIEKAEMYYNKVMKAPPEIRLHPNNLLYVAFSLAVFFAANNQWAEANDALAQGLKLFPQSVAVKFSRRYRQALILHLQGKDKEAETLATDAQRILEQATKKYEKVDVQANLMVPRAASVGEEFEVRFDIVNVGKKSGLLLRIENVVPAQFKIATVFPYCKIKESHLEFEEGNINPFQVKTIRLKVEASRTGIFLLEPQLIFVDALGETKSCKLEPSKVTIKHVLLKIKETNVEGAQLLFELKSEAAQKAIDFLIGAFKEDYVRRKLPQEKAGWRTLMDLVKQGKLTPYSVYGSVNHRGIVLSELEHSGLVQTRIFTGERGRGGNILKLRIAYEKEAVRQYTNQCSPVLKKL
jgi:tetratricopeptide (TPR) repeat protein